MYKVCNVNHPDRVKEIAGTDKFVVVATNWDDLESLVYPNATIVEMTEEGHLEIYEDRPEKRVLVACIHSNAWNKYYIKK